MVSPNVNNLLQQAKSLTLQEREQFLDLLTHQTQWEQQDAVQSLASGLSRKGIKLTIPPPRTSAERARFKAWRPVDLPGGSMSDELIRDRR
jgi:uncharacterized protein YaaR (DUF327 family)